MAKKKLKEVKIIRTDYPNISYGDLEGQTFQFKTGLPGQTMEIIPIKKRPQYVKSKVRRRLRLADYEVQEGCPAYGACGGCDYQKTSLEKEHALKEDQLKRLFEDYWTQDSHLYEALDPDQYRNKMEYTFGDEVKDGPLVLGLHRRYSSHDIVDTRGCTIAPKDFEKIRTYTQNFYRERQVPAYQRRRVQGTLRHLVLRKSFRKNTLMVNLVTRSQGEIYLEDYLEGLLNLDLEGKITSVYHTLNDQRGDAVLCDEARLLYGEEGIYEELMGLTFKITPFSFFQPNPLGIEKIYEKALDWAGDLKEKEAFDLYSGTGTLAQIMAQEGARVTAIEIVEDALENAREMAKENGLDNIDFHCGDVGKVLESLDKKADFVLVDPPRMGLSPQAMKNILKTQTQKIVYISCNPRTMKANLDQFVEEGYKLEKLVAFNQFPRTVHVEALTMLCKAKQVRTR